MSQKKNNDKVLKQINTLEKALIGIKSNFQTTNSRSYFKESNHSNLNPEGVFAEISNLKQSMSAMMDLFVTEIDGIKKEMYLEFAQNQRLLLADVDKIKHQQNILENKLIGFENTAVSSDRKGFEQRKSVTHMVDSVEDSVRTAILEMSQKHSILNEKFLELKENSKRQTKGLVEQGTNVESFLTEIVELIKETRKKDRKVSAQIFEFERNNKIHQREMKEMFSDLENRYSYFQDTIQGDVSMIMRTQRDTNGGLEKFVEMVEERTSGFEKATKTKLKIFSDDLLGKESAISGSGGSVDIEKVHQSIKKVKTDHRANSEKIQVLGTRFDNFRNEVNKLF